MLMYINAHCSFLFCTTLLCLLCTMQNIRCASEQKMLHTHYCQCIVFSFVFSRPCPDNEKVAGNLLGLTTLRTNMCWRLVAPGSGSPSTQGPEPELRQSPLITPISAHHYCIRHIPDEVFNTFIIHLTGAFAHLFMIIYAVCENSEITAQ